MLPPWLQETLSELAAAKSVGYLPDASAAAEPTAIAALALHSHGRAEAARPMAAALLEMQQPAGNVGVRAGETPGWPTSLAIVAWSAIETASGRREPPGISPFFENHIDRAVNWLLANRGQGIPRSPTFGHNTELIGWSYAEQTHSWVEPTSFAVLALQAAGHADHAATREGIALLLDRQLPGGGLNYGNTYVLGQLLRPHIQPTGIALLALQDQPESSIAKTLTWLRRSIDQQTTTLSLAWALLGLRAHHVEIPQADEWLAAAADRVRRTDRSPYKLALLALAQKGWPS